MLFSSIVIVMGSRLKSNTLTSCLIIIIIFNRLRQAAQPYTRYYTTVTQGSNDTTQTVT